MKTSEVLTEARDLIADLAHWGKFWLAVSAEQDGVYPTDPRAIRFCALGALGRAEWGESGAPVSAWQIRKLPEAQLLERVMGTDVADYNNSSGHADVIEAFNRAIQLANEEEGLSLQVTVATDWSFAVTVASEIVVERELVSV